MFVISASCERPSTAIRVGRTCDKRSLVTCNHLASSNRIRVKMVLQRPENIGERLELLRRQRVTEVSFDGPEVGCSRTPKRRRPVCCQRDLSTAAVGGAVVATDQTPSLHPPEVMGQPASLPVDGPGQLR